VLTPSCFDFLDTRAENRTTSLAAEKVAGGPAWSNDPRVTVEPVRSWEAAQHREEEAAACILAFRAVGRVDCRLGAWRGGGALRRLRFLISQPHRRAWD